MYITVAKSLSGCWGQLRTENRNGENPSREANRATNLTQEKNDMAKKKNEHLDKSDAAGGALLGGGLGVAAGHLGGAGLVIGRTAVGITAVAVVAVPAISAGAVAFTGWKIYKALKK